ncbi:MAG: hypothetical protein ABI632_00050 [Pseudolysinimonas sp.]
MTTDLPEMPSEQSQRGAVTPVGGPIKRHANWWGIGAVVLGFTAFTLIRQPVETIVVGAAAVALGVLGILQKTSGILGRVLAVFGLLISAGAVYAGFVVAVSGVQPF